MSLHNIDIISSRNVKAINQFLEFWAIEKNIGNFPVILIISRYRYNRQCTRLSPRYSYFSSRLHLVISPYVDT